MPNLISTIGNSYTSSKQTSNMRLESLTSYALSKGNLERNSVRREEKKKIYWRVYSNSLFATSQFSQFFDVLISIMSIKTVLHFGKRKRKWCSQFPKKELRVNNKNASCFQLDNPTVQIGFQNNVLFFSNLEKKNWKNCYWIFSNFDSIQLIFVTELSNNE